MEGLLGIVILAGIYSLRFVFKSLVSAPDVNAKPIAGEVFPQVNVMEVPREQDAAPVRVAPAKPNVDEAGRVAAKTNVNRTEKREKRNGRISLGNRSEAKKAFIYSEIFKRKY